MRVGLIGRQPDPFAHNIGDALQRTGHIVAPLSPAAARGSTRIGDATAMRAHRDHTYDLRVATILEKVA